MSLGEIFAAYHHTQLPAAVPYRRFVQWLADRDTAAARAAWGEVFAGFERPTLVGPPTRATAGQRGVCTNQLSVEITGAVGELARTCHATVNTVLQAAWAQLLMWQTGQRDVAFGTAVSGRPVDIPGSASMVGLLINTVPVRATLGPDTSSAALIAQLHHRHNDTLEHQHLGLNEIHRATGHEHLFDTLPGVIGGLVGGILSSKWGLASVFWSSIATSLIATGCAFKVWRLQHPAVSAPG